MKYLGIDFRMIRSCKFVNARVIDEINDNLMSKKQLEDLREDIKQLLEDVEFFIEKVEK